MLFRSLLAGLIGFLDPMKMSQPAFADIVKAEYARWGRIVKQAGAEPQ